MTAAKNLVARLRADHEHVETMFGKLSRAGDDKRADLFCELVNDLIRHEVAEETIVYPEVRRVVGNGERLADARIKEQAEAEELLAQMEKEDPSGSDFTAHLEKLEKAVLEHAQKEDELIFGPLDQALDAARSRQLGEIYEKAKSVAPTHPHPHAPDTPPGNLVAGPVAAVVDRTRDAMRQLAS